MDDKSLALVIRDAHDDGKRAWEILRELYKGRSKPRIIALYTESTSESIAENENVTDYIIRAERAALSLKAAEVVGDVLLVAMGLKCLPDGLRTFSTVVTKKTADLKIPERKPSMRSYEE